MQQFAKKFSIMLGDSMSIFCLQLALLNEVDKRQAIHAAKVHPKSFEYQTLCYQANSPRVHIIPYKKM